MRELLLIFLDVVTTRRLCKKTSSFREWQADVLSAPSVYVQAHTHLCSHTHTHTARAKVVTAINC